MTEKAAEKKSKKHEGGETFAVGDRVEWDSRGGTARGEIVRVATSPGKIKDFEYKASADDPRYIVETEAGKHAAHTAEELRRA